MASAEKNMLIQFNDASSLRTQLNNLNLIAKLSILEEERIEKLCGFIIRHEHSHVWRFSPVYKYERFFSSNLIRRFSFVMMARVDCY